MKMNKVLAGICLFGISAFMIPTFASAYEGPTEDSRPMLRYYLGDDGLYRLSEAQYQEFIDEGNFEEIAERDGLKPTGTEENPVVNEETEAVSNLERKSGRWTISDSVIRDGYRRNYFMPDGSNFVVEDGEEAIFSIGPDRECWLTFGCTGTNPYQDTQYIDMESWYGITIATDTAGSYKFYGENTDNGFDITVDGAITID